MLLFKSIHYKPIRYKNCKIIQKDLWDYVADRLPEGPFERVENHLNICHSCRREAEGVRNAQNLLLVAKAEPPISYADWNDLHYRLLNEGREIPMNIGKEWSNPLFVSRIAPKILGTTAACALLMFVGIQSFQRNKTASNPEIVSLKRPNSISTNPILPKIEPNFVSNHAEKSEPQVVISQPSLPKNQRENISLKPAIPISRTSSQRVAVNNRTEENAGLPTKESGNSLKKQRDNLISRIRENQASFPTKNTASEAREKYIMGSILPASYTADNTVY